MSQICINHLNLIHNSCSLLDDIGLFLLGFDYFHMSVPEKGTNFDQHRESKEVHFHNNLAKFEFNFQQIINQRLAIYFHFETYRY